MVCLQNSLGGGGYDHLADSLTVWSFMASQDYFTLLSHGKQVDETEEEVLHREPSPYLQAQRGFLTSSLNGVRTCSDTAAEDQIICQCL